MKADYYQFFFTNSAPPAMCIEIVVELARNGAGSESESPGRLRETAFAIAHKAIHRALDYDENKFASSSHDSFCLPNEVPELVLEVPTETLRNGGKVWLKIIS